MVPVERLRRSLARAGIWDAGPWTGQTPPIPASVLLLMGDHVYAYEVIAALVRSPDTVLVRGDGRAVAAHVPRERAEEAAHALIMGEEAAPDLPRKRGRDLVPEAELRQRRRTNPLVMPVSAELRGEVENRLFQYASKARTDLVSLLVWPRPARGLTRFAVKLGLTANQVTSFGLVLALAAALAFHAGWLSLGLAVAWAMSLTDAVDGRLARLTLSTSQVGTTLESALAVLHPPLWWWAWWAGGGAHDWAMAILVMGSLLIKAEEWLFTWRTGFPMHAWQRFDGLYRLVSAHRNLVLLLLTISLLAGHPQTGADAAAVWMAVCVVVHAVRLIQAWRSAPQG
jgi:phosphatidylglycerophosphate synthase